MKIEQKDLLEEMKVMIKDEFIADVQSNKNVIVLSFENGQKFSIEVKES